MKKYKRVHSLIQKLKQVDAHIDEELCDELIDSLTYIETKKLSKIDFEFIGKVLENLKYIEDYDKVTAINSKISDIIPSFKAEKFSFNILFISFTVEIENHELTFSFDGSNSSITKTSLLENDPIDFVITQFDGNRIFDT